MPKTIHMCVDLQGSLRRTDRELSALFHGDNGETLSGRYVRDWIKLQLMKGIKVVPMGPRCEGFSDIDGCPGHETPEPTKS